jgi:glycosyltransferase involved in cell wall biosynthesis
MRILQICPRVPWPPLDGGRVAMLQLTQSLGRAGAQVDVASLNQAKFPVDAAAASAALAPARLDAVDINTSSLLRAAMRMRRLRAPLLVARFYSPRFERLFRESLRVGRYDVVHIEGQFLLPYVPAIRKETRAPIVLRVHNVEFRIWERLAAQAAGIHAQGLQHIARTLGAWETTHLDDCDALVPIADEDDRDLRALGATRPSLVLPCGIDTREPRATAEIDPHRVYFIGSMLYRPNQEAVRWLADEVWPRVLALEPRARLTVAGSSFPAALREHLIQRSIDVASDVPDVRAFSAPFRAMLAPLFSGSGMRIKVLEAMALGKPVIATPLGAGGIDVTTGENILLAENPAELAQHVVRCMNDDALAQRIGNAARALVVERYDADVLARKLLGFYEELLRKAS